MTQMMQMMQNPQTYAMQHMMNQLINENPQQWQQTNKLFAGKNRQQQMATLEQLYQERGMNLKNVAAQWGIPL